MEKGIYLVEPHGRLIAERKKKAIVKSRKLPEEYLNRPVYICSKNYVFAYAILKKPKLISTKTFKKLFKKHRITEIERKIWARRYPRWGTGPLFFYELSKIRIFKRPKEYISKPGTQNVIKKVRFKDVESLKDYAQPGYSGIERGEMIYLKNILPYFGSFKLKRPFICLVGGLVSWGKTKGDIDILIRKKEPKDSYEDMPLKFRIMRMLPREYWNRLHFIYDEQGPFTSYIPLWDLVIEKQKVGREEMTEVKEVILMKPFVPAKAGIGYRKAEFFDPEEAFRFWAQGYFAEGKKIALEEKYDGMRMVIHRRGEQIKIFTEDRLRDRAHMFPKAVAELKKLSPSNFVLDFEMVEWKPNWKEPMMREDMVKWIVSKKKLDDTWIKFNIFDCLYFENKSLTNLPWNERQSFLKKVLSRDTKHLHRVVPELAKNKGEFLRAFDRVSKEPGSEGAMLKVEDSKYEIGGRMMNWAKVKKVIEIAVQIIGIKHPVHKKGPKKGKPIPGTFFYESAVRGPKGEKIRIGKTYATAIKAKIGDIIDVRTVRVEATRDPRIPGGYKISWMFPIVKSRRPEKKRPDSLSWVLKIAKLTPPKKLMQLETAPLKIKFLGTRGEIEESSKKHFHQSGVVLTHDKTKILLDFGKSLKGKLKKINPDAIFITHAHPDHLEGLEEGTTKPIFASKEVHRNKKFQSYLLEDIRLLEHGKPVRFEEFKIIPYKVLHSLKAPAMCFRIEVNGKKILYAPDVIAIKEREKALKGINLYIGDGSSLKRNLIRRKDKKIFGHSSVKTQVTWLKKFGIKRAIFTHWGKEAVEMPPKKLKKIIKTFGPNISIASDGKEFSFGKIEMIVDIEKYNPSQIPMTKAGNKRLADDWRISHMWYSTWKNPKKEIRFTKDQIVKCARKIFREIAKRVKLGKMKHKFKPEKMKPNARELFNLVVGKKKKMALQKRKKKMRFVLQLHYRGKSVHADLRFEKNDFLWGHTLDLMVEEAIPEPVFTMAEARKWFKRAKWKIDWKTGETIRLPTGEPMKILTQAKAIQPKIWLTLEGIIPPGRPGATKEYPGVMLIIDKGWVEFGAQKPFYEEYFIHGKILKGRYIIRRLPTAGFRPRPGRPKFKIPMVWFFWKAKEPIPYVISKRAIDANWLPPAGESAMPKEIENKIPENLRFWKEGLARKERLKRRAIIRTLLKKKKLKLQKAGTRIKFYLSRHWWKGQFVIRGMPVEHWDLRFATKKAPYPYFTLDKNPVAVQEKINAIYKKCPDKRWLTFAGEILPKGKEKRKWLIPGNPNKRISAFVDRVDEGEVSILEVNPLFVSMIFRGKELKGYWIFRRSTPKEPVWVMSKSELPKPKVEKEEVYIDFPLELEMLSEEFKMPYEFYFIALKEGKFNNVFYPAEEIRKGAKTLEGKNLTIDHGKSVRDIIGKIKEAHWNEKKERIEGIGIIKDTPLGKQIASEIHQKLIKGVSVEVLVHYYFGKHGRSAKDLEFVALSLVRKPAFKNGIKKKL